MKPQPPVTKIRIAPRNSSGRKPAPAVSAPSAGGGIFAALEGKAAFWLILGLAAFLRIFLLGIKPPHFDEGINGWFVDQMVKTGFYKYDPTNYHGPLHFYILFAAQSLFGRNVWVLRLPVVFASIASVWLALNYERIFPRLVARVAALAMAVSPGFVFYGRYSIHEVWLQLFSMMFMLGLMGLWRVGAARDLWFAGIGLAGMILTKETYIIHLGCALVALPITYLSLRITPGEEARPAAQTWTRRDLFVLLFVSLAAIVFFYSGTFLHWTGLRGLYRTFHAWFETGHAGNGHAKPWYYWLMLIGRYEWPVAAGLIGCAFCQMFRRVTLRFLAITAVGILMAYSIVNYKTPWCVISIAWPFLFIFGALIIIVGATDLRKPAIVSACLLLVSLGFCINLNFFRCSTFTDTAWNPEENVFRNTADFFASEPYVYVQTYNDVYKLTDPLLALAHQNPTYYHLVGHLIRPSPYPLPWILGDFSRIGYYEHNNLPAVLDADFLLVEDDKIATVEAKLTDSYYTEPLAIRPYQDTSKLYLRAGVFKRFFPDRAPDFLGKAR